MAWGISITSRLPTSTIIYYRALGRIIDHDNHQRLHTALGYQTPTTWYRGDPERVAAARRLKPAQTRHRRKQINLGIRQRTLTLTNPETVLSK
ncbi:MAG: hypothetical protein AAGB00_03710 [Planctomycetota bacterium]